jgi:hypothetical protein
LIACQPPGPVAAEIVRPRSVLVIIQSDVLVPYYVKLLSKLTAVVNAAAGPRVSLYEEVLDLPRFDGQAYGDSLQRHFQIKYRDRPIGVSGLSR